MRAAPFLNRLKQMKLLEGLNEIDEIISERWRTLTCAEVSGIYDDIWYGVKELNGNAAGYVGFSEFVVFRFLVNRLGEASPRAINKETSAFQCDLDGRCWLTHSADVGGLRPDVAIWWKDPSHTFWQPGGELWAAVEIKAGLDQGSPLVVNIQTNFQNIMSKNPRARCLLISYRNPTVPVRNALANSNIKYMILDSDQTPLWLKLYENLEMARAPFSQLIRAYPPPTS
jgi:hypothetical protein